MKKKKILSLLVLPVLVVLILVGCGKKTVETKMTSEQGGIKTSIVLYSEGDKVTKQTTESTIPYSALAAMNINNKEDAKKYFDGVVNAIGDIKGYSDKFEYKEDRAIEKASIDYSIIDIKDLPSLPGFMGDETDASKAKAVSLKKTVEVLETAGYKKVK